MVPESPSLDGLLRRLAEGDRGAFTPAFALLWPVTLKLCERLMGNEADAADAAQAAMVRVLEKAYLYDSARPALPWALGIASWECRTLQKRRARRRETNDRAAPESDGGQAALEQEQRLMVGAALGAMGTLSEGDQETLVATYWETAAGASGPTLRKRRERALTRLRGAFRRLYGLD